MAHKLYKLDGDNAVDLSNLCGEINRRSTAQEVSEEVSFSITSEDELKNDILQEGDILVLKNDTKTLWKGVVITRKSNGRFTWDIQAFDFGWYLNKNEDIYQFNNTVSENIKKILNDYQVAIGSIVDIPTTVKDVKRGTLIHMIKDMLELAEKDQGKKYRYEIRDDKFYLEELTDNPIKYTTSIINNIDEDVTKYISSPSISKSIDGLFNSIRVAGEEKNSIKQIAGSADDDSIKKYGKIQKLEFLSKDDYSKGPNIATNQLKALNRVVQSISVTLLGNDDCRANRVITIKEPVTGIDGNFRIKKCSHKITPTSHTMQLDLEVL